MHRIAAGLAVVAVVTSAACGASPQGSAPATGGSVPAAAAAKYKDWPGYGAGPYRTSNASTMPAARGALTVAHRIKLDGAVYASPIVVHGVTVVATENDTVYALSSSYKVIWKRHLGSPSPAGQRPCGNIDPLGITGTPVYSATTNAVYVAPEFSGSPPQHRLYALSFSSGATKWSRTLDFSGVSAAAMQERGALLVSGSRVYVPFGGLAGDCAAYKGRVVSYPLTGSNAPQRYTVPTAREAGIWTPPGPAGDSAGNIFVAVGNGASGASGAYDHSDSILELDRALRLRDSFSPSSWRHDNDNDLDLGSQGARIAGNWIFSAGKSGTAYVLRRSHLGGIGGQVSSASLCKSFGNVGFDGRTLYVPCTDGLRAVRISAGGHLQVLWHASSSTTGSPSTGGGRVWALDTGNGVLHALDPSTGRSTRSIAVGSVTRFAALAIYGRTIAVPTTTGLTVVTAAA